MERRASGGIDLRLFALPSWIYAHALEETQLAA